MTYRRAGRVICALRVDSQSPKSNMQPKASGFPTPLPAERQYAAIHQGMGPIMETWIVIVFWIAAAFGLAGILYGLTNLPQTVRREIYAGGGIALCSTLLVSTSILRAESSINDSKEEANWKEKIQYQDKIPGFNPGSHPSWKEINYSAKDMSRAQLQNRNAKGIRMSDAILNEADFTKTRLEGANLAGSTFDGTIFTGADLSGADLRDAHLEFSDIRNAKSLKGAKVNVGTCWPEGFVKQNSEMMQDLVVVGKKDTIAEGGVVKTTLIKEKGREIPNCLLGRGGK
ncbi:pentapeptide repeat-containing protein [Streptomyces europaeiscabiei]|uniref:pentapeptide repeat-containing protein n=1 Tax=Streptomyces europaeiscabiei TaxID=146819 RepID=UPI0038F65897